ncbi:MAG: hypothetical protein IBJ10_10395 [Phycisphaerales bacterium]|nr:hypothetical protein [Phycisphaerales bacterium]
MSNRAPRAVAACAGVLVLATLAGCLASGNSSTTVSGRYVGPETISRIEPGVTTREWVQATLGEPTSRTALSDGRTEVWRWEHRSVSSSRATALLLVRGSNRHERVGAAIVEIVDGVVTRAWIDATEVEADCDSGSWTMAD